jgi:hypothetical protein
MTYLRKRLDEIQEASIKLSTETVMDYASAKAILSMFSGVPDDDFQEAIVAVERLASLDQSGPDIVNAFRLLFRSAKGVK